MTASLSPIRRPDEYEEPDGGTMSFLEHLDDLRRRLIHSCLALAVGMALAFAFMDPLVSFVMAPTHRALPLAKMRVVTSRFLWRHLRYAILIIFIVAAVLTPSPDPWNMTIFAMPMLALYLIGIGVAWLAEPRHPRSNHAGLRLVFAAAVLDQAWKRRTLQRAR